MSAPVTADPAAAPSEPLAAPSGATEIRGPSAYGGGLRRFFDLTWMIALNEYRLAYFGSVLGPIWTLMRPLLLFGVLFVVFSQIIDFGGNIKHYPMLLLFNMMLFGFFADASGSSVTAVLARESLVRKMQFPRMVIPLSVVMTAALNLLQNMVAVLIFILAYGIEPRWTWLLLPVVLLPLLIITSGVAMLLSSLYVSYRDVDPIWAVVSTVLFYGSPVLYAIDTVREEGGETAEKVMLLLNPFASILEQGRHWIIDPSAPSAVEAIGGWLPFMAPVGICLGIFALGLWVFNREAPKIAERL